MTLREYLNKQQAEVYNNIIQNKLIEKENEKYKNIKIIKTSKKKINKKNTASTTPIQKINTILHNTENIEELDTKLPPVAEIEQSITNTIIPQNLNDISLFYSNNYSAIELKVFAKFHKLSQVGNKSILLNRIISHIIKNNVIIKIQKIFRGFHQRIKNSLRGPALFNRKLCNNENDFLSYEELKDIKYYQFFSFRDNDGFIWGFDILSFYNLIYTTKNNKKQMSSITNIKNPYNRNLIPIDIIHRMNKLLVTDKHKINIIIPIVESHEEKNLDFRVLELFQSINSLGHYSDLNWFMNLDLINLVKYILELMYIWNFRSQLSNQTKCSICYPHGNPFRNINILSVKRETNINNLRKIILDIMEQLVYSGINTDNRTLGSYYVLGALTLVSTDASNSIPWLHMSMV